MTTLMKQYERLSNIIKGQFDHGYDLQDMVARIDRIKAWARSGPYAR